MSLSAALLFVLVVPAAAACGGNHDSKRRRREAVPTCFPPSRDEVRRPRAGGDRGEAGRSARQADEPLEIPSKFADAMALGKALTAKGDNSRAKEVLERPRRWKEVRRASHRARAQYIAMGEKGLAIKEREQGGQARARVEPGVQHARPRRARAVQLRQRESSRSARPPSSTPTTTWAWNNLGFTHLQLKHYQDAIEALETATGKKDAAGYMFNNLGLAYEQLDKLGRGARGVRVRRQARLARGEASRKRLEGVDTITVTAKAETPKVIEKTYENVDEMPRCRRTWWSPSTWSSRTGRGGSTEGGSAEARSAEGRGDPAPAPARRRSSDGAAAT